VGDAALLVDPHKPGEIAKAITRVLENPPLQDELRQKGYKQAARYTWQNSARKMLAVYQQVYEGKAQFNHQGEDTL
jgi:glycosyltransferase involved in cell wall biosynthesis